MDATPSTLTVDDVLTRYHLKDRRVARRLMDEAGAFLVGGRLLVREEDLRAHEEHLRADRHATLNRLPHGRPMKPTSRPGARRRRKPARAEPLPVDWYVDRS